MPAQTINLLTQKDFDRTLVGKFLRWALTYGRYIIISTEIIVLLAFIYRFSLDRQITDLNEEIDQKAAIVAANSGFESSFRNLQNRTQQISSLIAGQNKISQVLIHLEQIAPAGIKFNTLTVAENKVTISATLLTSSTLSTFVNNLRSSPLLSHINITQAARSGTESLETKVQIEAELQSQTPLTTDVSNTP